MSQKRVLVADDDDAFRQLVKVWLERLNLTVDEASDGFLALRMCHEAEAAQQPYDLIVMDLHMAPGWNGDEAATKLADLKPRPRVLLCTGSTDSPLLSYAEVYGFDAVLHKPFPTGELVAICSTLLGISGETPAPVAAE